MITTSQIPSILESIWNVRNEIVPCLLGMPGIGKTQMVYEFARKHDANVVEIIASQILPSEVSGITMPDKETKSMEIYDHARLSSLKDGDILFLDELLQASPQVLSAFLTLIQERRMMSGKMLPDIMIVAAANPVNSAAMIPFQVKQRFQFIEVEFDKLAWCNYNAKMFKIPADALNKLAGYIELNDRPSEYNILTPRTLSKLIAWHQSCQSDRAMRSFRLYTESVYGLPVFKALTKAFEAKDNKLKEESAKRKILSIAEEHVSNFSMNESDSLASIMEALMQLSEWDEIQKTLQSIDMNNLDTTKEE